MTMQTPDSALVDNQPPTSTATVTTVQINLLPLGTRASNLITAIGAGLFASLTFLACADGAIVTVGQVQHLPNWMIMALAAPVTAAGLWIGYWMLRATYRYETRASLEALVGRTAV